MEAFHLSSTGSFKNYFVKALKIFVTAKNISMYLCKCWKMSETGVDCCKILFGLLFLILTIQIGFNIAFFVLAYQNSKPVKPPYCKTCTRLCGFWKCITVNTSNGDELSEDSGLEVVEFVVNISLSLFGLILSIILCVKSQAYRVKSLNAKTDGSVV